MAPSSEIITLAQIETQNAHWLLVQEIEQQIGPRKLKREFLNLDGHYHL